MSQPERLYWISAQIRAGRFPSTGAVSERFRISRRTPYSDPTCALPFLALTE